MKATLCLPTKADAWFPGVGRTQPHGTERGLWGQPILPAPRPASLVGARGSMDGGQPGAAAGLEQEHSPQDEGSFFPAPGYLGCSWPVPLRRGVDGAEGARGCNRDSLPGVLLLEALPHQGTLPQLSPVSRLAHSHQLTQAPPEPFAGLKLVLLSPLTKAGQALQRLKLPLAFRLP